MTFKRSSKFYLNLWLTMTLLAFLLAGCNGFGTFELGLFKEPVSRAWLLCAPAIGCIVLK
jgi:hypothetical protein